MTVTIKTKGPAETTTVLPHCKISWGGSLGNPKVEIWANSVAWVPKDNDMSGVISQGLVGEQAQMGGLSQAIQDWFSLPLDLTAPATQKGTGIGQAAVLEWVKFNAVGSDGKYLFPSNTFFYANPVHGGGTTGQSVQYSNPEWATTYAITMRGTVARGRGSHGRIYPPLAGCGPEGTTPYLSLNAATQMTNAFTGLLDNFNSGFYFGPEHGYDTSGTAEHIPGNCVISSVVPHRGPHAGAPALLTPIVGVEVDRVADVMTSRVNKVARLTAGRQSVTLNL